MIHQRSDKAAANRKALFHNKHCTILQEASENEKLQIKIERNEESEMAM